MKQLWEAGLLLWFASTLSDAFFWLPGTEVVYDYHVDLDTISKYPVESTSRWTIKGNLVVQGAQDIATVQLQDVNISTYTGPVKHNTPIVETPPPEDANQLLQPFILHFEEGKLVALSVKAGEDVWSINMKRGIAGLVQLDPGALHLSTSISTENGLHGNCRVEYSARNFTNSTLSVTKSIDFSTCPGSTTQGFSSSGETLCPASRLETSVDVISVRRYILEPSGPGGEYIISSVTANGGIAFQPFKYKSEIFNIWTWVEMKLKKVGATENPLTVKGGGERVDLKYVLPIADVTQGRSVPTQEELVSAITKMLHKLGESLDPLGLEKNLITLHEERVTHIVYFLSLLNHASLSRLYSDLAIGTSYQHETFRNLFIELLPLVGTHDAALLIRDLVIGGTLKNDTAVELLTALPFSLRSASEQLLKDLEVILTLPEDSVLYNSAILTFATVVHSVCKSGCSSEIEDKYVRQYLDLFTSSDTLEKQLLYLQALGNFQLGRVAEYFEPIIQGTDTKYSHYVRYLALWLPDSEYLNSEKVFELYWPIFSNRDELLEMRVSALIILIRGLSSTARIYNILNYMLDEPDPHLRHFWYTSLHSIVQTNHPYYIHLLELIKKAIRFYPEPDVHQSLSGHYIIDYLNSDHGFGSMGEIFTLANPHTGSPYLIVLHLSSTAGICGYLDYTLYVRLEGVGDFLNHINPKDTLNVDKLVELLKQLKVPSKGSEPLHVELILQTQDQTILVHYFNETTYNSIVEVLKNMKILVSGGVHVNAQNIVVPYLLEEMQSTDVGTIALLRITHSWLMSIRANLTTGKLILNQLDFRSYLSSQAALTQYNPVLNMWHGAQRSLNLQIVIPFDLQFSVQSGEDYIKFAIQHKPGEEAGVIGHVETVVLVRGINATDKLKSHCPTCLSHHVIKGNKDHPYSQDLAVVELLGSKLELSFLDCEHSYQKEDLLSWVQHAEEHQNSHMIPSLGPLLTLAHLYDSAILVHPSGSCGFLVKLSSFVNEPTQIEVEIKVNRTHKSQSSTPAGDYAIQILVTSNSSSSWEIDLHYAPSKHRLTTNLSSEDSHIGSVDIHAQFPEAVEEVTFISSKEPHSALVEISAEWDTSSLQIRMGGEVTSEQQDHATDPSVWPYNTCQKDLHDTEQWGELYAPLTLACYEVARELATLRKYHFSVISNNLPAWLNFLPEGNVTVEVEVPQDSRAIVNVNGHKKFLDLLESKELQPLLINTHFPPLLQFATHMGTIGSCVVTSKSVWTVDGVHLDSHLGKCYSLAVAVCSETPHFALFVKKTDSKWFPLALKLYIGDSTVELLPNAHKINITVNDLEVTNPEQGYEHPLGESNYHFRVWKRSDGLVRIYLALSRIWIEYYGHFATVTVPGVFRGKLCGLCGNFNRDTRDDTVHLYTISCTS